MTPQVIEKSEDAVLFEVHLGVYSLIALLKAVYWLTGDNFVHIQYKEPSSKDIVQVRVSPKNPVSTKIDVSIAEFFNRLLDQELREKIGIETNAQRDLILAHALSKTPLINKNKELE